MHIGIDLRIAAGATGQQRYLWRLGRWLAGRGHEIELLVTNQNPARAVDAGAARVHALAELPPDQLPDRVRELELDVLLLNPERSDAYDGLRANVLRPGYGTDQYRQKLRSFRNPLERRLRSALRGLPPTRGRRERERRFYEGQASPPEVIAVSDYMRREIVDTYRVPPERVHVVPNGIDLEEFSPERRVALRDAARQEFGIPGEALCILFVAHNFRLKGVHMGMDQIRRLRTVGVDAHLLVAGRGTGATQRARARRWASRMGIASATHLPGEVVPAMRAFAAADVFLHPSWHDAFGFAVLEAMGAGLPPLTSPWTGASMLVDEGRAGFVVEPADTGTIYRRLRELSDPAVRLRMGGEARRIAEGYGEEVNFERVEEVCALAADRRDGPVR